MNLHFLIESILAIALVVEGVLTRRALKRKKDA